MTRIHLAALGFALALAAGACGRYGPPVRRIEAAQPQPAAQPAPAPSNPDLEPSPATGLDTSEDEQTR